MLWFKDNAPLENYILKVLLKNKYNVQLSHQEIYAKYPMLKKWDLKTVINEILQKQIKKEKISGVWKRIGKEWKLLADAYEWSGKDLPGSIDENKFGNNLGTYSKPNGQPRNYENPDQKVKFDPEEEAKPVSDKEISDEQLQTAYDELYKEFIDSFNSITELNKIILEELVKKYGSQVTHIKLKKDK